MNELHLMKRLNSVFSLESFCCDSDYRNGTWFPEENWEVKISQWKPISKTENDLSLFIKGIFEMCELEPQICMMPTDEKNSLTHSLSSFDELIQLIKLDNDSVIKYLDFTPWVLFDRTLRLVIIFEVDLGIVVFGYNSKFLTLSDLQDLTYEEYLEEIDR